MLRYRNQVCEKIDIDSFAITEVFRLQKNKEKLPRMNGQSCITGWMIPGKSLD